MPLAMAARGASAAWIAAAVRASAGSPCLRALVRRPLSSAPAASAPLPGSGGSPCLHRHRRAALVAVLAGGRGALRWYSQHAADYEPQIHPGGQPKCHVEQLGRTPPSPAPPPSSAASCSSSSGSSGGGSGSASSVSTAAGKEPTPEKQTIVARIKEMLSAPGAIQNILLGNLAYSLAIIEYSAPDILVIRCFSFMGCMLSVIYLYRQAVRYPFPFLAFSSGSRVPYFSIGVIPREKETSRKKGTRDSKMLIIPLCQFSSVQPRLYIPILWNVLFCMILTVQIFLLLRNRRDINFSTEEAILFAKVKLGSLVCRDFNHRAG
jgi:hypothetical protein